MKKWDVFISHASEDKEEVALPLANQFKRAGIRAWLDRHELRLGDSLREAIDAGLSQSRFGIVILSPAFLAKGWPRNELNALMSLEDIGRKVILPVWHKIDKQTLSNFSPMLADRLAVDTSHGLGYVVGEVARVVFAPDSDSPSAASPGLHRRFSELLDSDADISSIRDFIGAHPALLPCAMHLANVEQNWVIKRPRIGAFRPDFCVGASRLSPGDHQWTIVKLGPVKELSGESPLRHLSVRTAGGDLQELMQWIRKDQLRQPYSLYRVGYRDYDVLATLPPGEVMYRANAIYVCGRRSHLDGDGQELLRGLNHMLSFLDITVRTYDFLLDAAESVTTAIQPHVKDDSAIDSAPPE